MREEDLEIVVANRPEADIGRIAERYRVAGR